MITMKTTIALTLLTASLFACNNSDQKPVVKAIAIKKPNPDSGFQVTSVKREQHFNGTLISRPKKQKLTTIQKKKLALII